MKEIEKKLSVDNDVLRYLTELTAEKIKDFFDYCDQPEEVIFHGGGTKNSFLMELLGEKLKKHNAQAWLVNTGWSGGAYGTGERIDLPITRRMLTSILDGELENTDFIPDPNFKILVPDKVPGVDSNILNPRNTWNDKESYDAKANELIALFKNNFIKYESFGDYSKAGPD